MNDCPRLSIVMPVLNESTAIVAALGALAPPRESGVEVIVVDGGSSDGTVAAAISLADRVLSAPRGRASQMNAGAAEARGQMLLFLRADTRLPPHVLALVERALGHLQTFLPRRIWAEALASAPLMGTRADSRDLGRPTAPPAANDST